MLSTSNQLLRLSQGQLNLLETCPRKFQHTYLEQLALPTDPENEPSQILGSRFHLLMQQQAMGLPIEDFLQEDTQLKTWMINFANAAPDILFPPTGSEIFRESEHYRVWQIQDFLFTVIYDLMIADHQQAEIHDWKTYREVPNRANLAQNWQTKLYMYILAETSEYLPENISLTYWFIQSSSKPDSIKFTYDRTQHRKIAQELNELLGNLTVWLREYQHNQPFPQIYDHKKICDRCQFVTRCERQQIQAQKMAEDLIPNFTQIPEVVV